MPIRAKYWESKEALYRAVKSSINVTYHLGDRQTRDRVAKPLAEVNKELSICRDALSQFK